MSSHLEEINPDFEEMESLQLSPVFSPPLSPYLSPPLSPQLNLDEGDTENISKFESMEAIDSRDRTSVV